MKMKKATKSMKTTKKVKTGSSDTGMSFTQMAEGVGRGGVIRLSTKGSSSNLMPTIPKAIKKTKPRAMMTKKKY